MRSIFSKFAFMASILLALVLTFSCSGGGGDDGDNGLSSASNGGGISSPGGGSSSPSGSGDKGNNISNYKTKQIGNQNWMAENLNYNVTDSKCYDGKESNCDKYGRLYDWTTAMVLPASCKTSSCASQISAKHRGICPSGWHIPNDADWDELIDFVGGASTAGTKLKFREGWELSSDSSSYVPSGTDEFGFSALPGGYSYSSGKYIAIGFIGYWWSASDGTYRSMSYDLESVRSNASGRSLFSVRCVQD